jgi:hypothetical protein
MIFANELRLESMTPSGTYGLYLCFVIIGLVLAYFCYPETSKLTLIHRPTMKQVLTRILRGPVDRRGFQPVFG